MNHGNEKISNRQGNVFSKPIEKEWWKEDGGFFGINYMEGDNSLEGYLSIPQTLQERSRHEVEGVIKLLELQPHHRVLDCPCGYGRHSIELARYGLEVVGVDINSYELEVAYHNSEGLFNVQFIREDLRFLDFENEFDAVVNLFFSYGFFEAEEDNIQGIRNFYNALKPGGKFLFHTDVNLPRLLNGQYKFSEIRHLQNGKKLKILESYDQSRKRLNGQWIFVNPDGSEKETAPYSARVYSFNELSELCRQVGFKAIVGYGDWISSPLTDSSEDMILIAQK